MHELYFKVQGSAPEPYEVTFIRRSENNLSAFCTCLAGEKGQYCKHRINILSGITTGIVSMNEADVKTVISWLPGTDIESAIVKMIALEKEAEKIKMALSAAKRDVAKSMRD